MSDVDQDRLHSLCMIMAKAHALAEVAWPRDACGRSAMPKEGLHAIMDIQTTAAAELGLPPDLDLMTGDPLLDL